MVRAGFLWISIIFIMFLTSAGIGADLKEMSVQVKVGELRVTPSFLGKIVGRVAYGDRVAVLESRNPWIQVQAAGAGAVSGWIHQSALTPDRIVLKAGSTDVQQTASGDELALAGKGFNEQVEESFKAKNPKVDFAWIDKMETLVVSDDQMRIFLEQGEIQPKAGAK